ncbi:hypothetical protein [Pandoraea oxalativorans]|uniref:hypothetical protein n=1 Tax=Pandoraea oxalativorans TaxID=573737 RepID=UPI001B80959C|nr:hypothetical protein [Pandoraea oxalativorans]
MGIDMLVSRLRHASVTRREISASLSDTGSIGHMGYFRQRSGAFAWPDTIDWLLSTGAVNAGERRTGADVSTYDGRIARNPLIPNPSD